jgi:hypothetical protein
MICIVCFTSARNTDSLHNHKIRSSTPAMSPIATPSKDISSEDAETAADDDEDHDATVSGIEPLNDESFVADSVVAEQGTEFPDQQISTQLEDQLSTQNNRDEGDGSSNNSFQCYTFQR